MGGCDTVASEARPEECCGTRIRVCGLTAKDWHMSRGVSIAATFRRQLKTLAQGPIVHTTMRDARACSASTPWLYIKFGSTSSSILHSTCTSVYSGMHGACIIRPSRTLGANPSRHVAMASAYLSYRLFNGVLECQSACRKILSGAKKVLHCVGRCAATSVNRWKHAGRMLAIDNASNVSKSKTA